MLLYFWMFAAIFICGASVVVTSCGDDDDDKGTQQPTTGNTYEVTRVESDALIITNIQVPQEMKTLRRNGHLCFHR